MHYRTVNEYMQGFHEVAYIGTSQMLCLGQSQYLWKAFCSYVG